MHKASVSDAESSGPNVCRWSQHFVVGTGLFVYDFGSDA